MIPLHVHSNYSILKGAVSIEALVERAKSYGLPALALTDDNGMYGLIKFAKLCIENNIKPILGSKINDPLDEDLSAIFLAKNNNGYSKLCKIITSRKLNEDFSLIKLINTGIDDIFIITDSIELLKKIKPGRLQDLYAELIYGNDSSRNTRELFEYCTTHEIKVVATAPIYFLNKDDFLIHQVLSSIRLNENLENLKISALVSEEFYFKNPFEVAKKWHLLPDAIKASEFISENCNVDLKFNELKFPRYDLPPGETPESLLHKETYKGLAKRYRPITEIAKDRLRQELSVIEEMNFAGYFLVVNDIVNEAKKRGMMLIGRGSAANSIVAYCLGLTQVDPIKHNFYFERFLNKGRSNAPDVDIDFSWKERDEIIKFIFDKYGYQNVAMISTTVTFRARSAFREVAKAFGLSNDEISKYSKFIPWTNAENLPNISELFPEARSLKFNVEPWKNIVEIASKIARFPRHLSIHPSGIIITPTPVTDYTALEYAKNKGLGLIITQPDMYSIEDLGLVKIDILSQRSLGVLRDTMSRIESNIGY